MIKTLLYSKNMVALVYYHANHIIIAVNVKNMILY